MGQALWCYECCWFTECMCVGISYSLLCCNCWLCMPAELEAERGGQPLKCGACNYGCGGTLLCCGQYCLAPDWLRRFSMRMSIGNFRGPLGDVQIIQRGGPSPSGQGIYRA